MGAEWALAHPGNGTAMPVSLYGDEAKYNEHNDKFLALALQSPLVRVEGFRCAGKIIWNGFWFLRSRFPAPRQKKVPKLK